MNICKYLNITGPACIQLKQDENNKYKFIEINPRFGGGLYFSTLAGVNIPEMMLELFSNQQVTINEPKEITVVRYFEEIII
jgi:carbamoyl-phosphate synthase large subunit